MLETAYSTIQNIPVAIVAAIVAALLRNIAGYIENVYRDDKADQYDIKQLVGTMVKYFGAIMLLMTGLPIGQSVAGAFILDVGTSAMKKMNK